MDRERRELTCTGFLLTFRRFYGMSSTGSGWEPPCSRADLNRHARIATLIPVGCVSNRQAGGGPGQVGTPTLGGNHHRKTFMESNGEMRCLRSPNSIGTPHSRFFTPLGPSAKVRGTPGSVHQQGSSGASPALKERWRRRVRPHNHPPAIRQDKA